MNKTYQNGRPGALVIGGDYQGLGIVRSLGRHGIPVFVLDDEYSISRFSRYSTRSLHVPDLRDEATTVKTLLEVAERFNLRGWVLYPTRDELVATLSRHKPILSEWFRVPTPEWETIRWIWDKRNTYQLAKDLGIPFPKTWFPRNMGDLDQIDSSYPLAVKPAIKEHFFYATRAKAWRANSPDELRSLYKRASGLSGPEEVLIQDLIPGGGSQQLAYCAFYKHGIPVGKMVVCRKRQHPHEFGRASTYVETIDMPEIEKLSEQFLAPINYYGLVEVEFKQDPRDGILKLLDVNARTWGYHSLGFAAGVDFPYLLYRDQVGENVEPVSSRPGVSWVRMVTDFPTGLADVSNGRIKLSEYIRSIRKADAEAVFSWKDPFPGIVECALLPYLMVRRGF
jgi:D-aspartate ligase